MRGFAKISPGLDGRFGNVTLSRFSAILHVENALVGLPRSAAQLSSRSHEMHGALLTWVAGPGFEFA
jgi:hypothetical protein